MYQTRMLCACPTGIFRMRESWRHDHGYPVARIEWVHFVDTNPTLPLEDIGSNEQQNDLISLSTSLEATLDAWMDMIRTGGWERT